MGKGESVDMVASKRESFSSTVNIMVTNNTEEYLDVRKDWVKGGEAINRPVSQMVIRIRDCQTEDISLYQIS